MTEITLKRLEELRNRLRAVADTVSVHVAPVFTDRADQVDVWVRRLQDDGKLDAEYVMMAIEEFEALCKGGDTPLR